MVRIFPESILDTMVCGRISSRVVDANFRLALRDELRSLPYSKKFIPFEMSNTRVVRRE